MSRNHAEDRLQMMVVSLLESYGRPGLWFCHIPNEGKRSPATGNLLKKKGLKPGAPDLVFCWFGEFSSMELKVKGKKQTDVQEAAELEIDRAGGRYFLATGYDEAFDVLEMLGFIDAVKARRDPRFIPRSVTEGREAEAA